MAGVSTFLTKRVGWKGEFYEEGLNLVPMDLALALGLKFDQKAAEPEVETVEEEKEKPKEVTSELLEPFAVGGVLTEDVIVGGKLNLDAKDLTAEQIAVLPGIGTVIGAELVRLRPVNGFHTMATFEQVARKQGHGKLDFTRISRRVVFEG